VQAPGDLRRVGAVSDELRQGEDEQTVATVSASNVVTDTTGANCLADATEARLPISRCCQPKSHDGWRGGVHDHPAVQIIRAGWCGVSTGVLTMVASCARFSGVAAGAPGVAGTGAGNEEAEGERRHG
jgi:hypothetical protein